MPPRNEDLAEARRRFLKSCGRFAAITPPAVTLMLSAASHHYAVALSGRAQLQGNNGFGNGGGDGVPGNSGDNPSPNSDQKNQDSTR